MAERRKLTAVVINDAEGIRDMITTLMGKRKVDGYRENIIGFDAEWCNSTNGETTHEKTKISHLIFTKGDFAFIFLLRDYHMLPEPILSFLRHPEFTFVSMGIQENLDKLGELYQSSCRNKVDLGRLAAKLTRKPLFRNCGIDRLAEGIGLSETPRPSTIALSQGYVLPYPEYKVFEDYKLDKNNMYEAVSNTCAYQRMGKYLFEEWSYY